MRYEDLSPAAQRLADAYHAADSDELRASLLGLFQLEAMCGPDVEPPLPEPNV